MAAHQLPRFSKSILDKPQLILPEKLVEIASVLDNHSEYLKYRKEAVKAYEDNEDSEVKSQFGLMPDNVGVLTIDGNLTAKATVFQALCGGASYDMLISTTEKYAEEGKDTLLMHISSGGGEAYKLFASANQIKKIAKSAGMKIVAYIDGIAASAAYGLASIADEIIAHPESTTIGSIGVIVSMIDNSKQLDKEGIRRVIVSAGANKHPFDDDGSFKESYLDNVQESIDKLYANFVNHVSTHRNLSKDFIISTEASTYHADEAMEKGLIDRMMEEDEFQAYLGGYSITPEQQQGTTQVAAKLTKTDEEILMSKNTEQASSVDAEQLAQLQELETIKTKLAALEAEKEQASTELANYKAKEALAAKEALEAKLDSSAWAADCKDSLVSVLLSDEVSGTYKELLNTVIASADMAVNELTGKVEEATSALTVAQEEFAAKEETLKAEMNTIQEEFGAAPQTTEEALPQTDTTSLSIEEQLAINLKKLNANK